LKPAIHSHPAHGSCSWMFGLLQIDDVIAKAVIRWFLDSRFYGRDRPTTFTGVSVIDWRGYWRTVGKATGR
jgi:hypothetical protein